MRFLSRKIKLYMLAFTLIGLTILSVVNFSSACQLETISFNDNRSEELIDKFGLHKYRSIVNQPLENVVEKLIEKKNVFRVNIDYQFPGELSIKTNSFIPSAYLLDKQSGEIVGVNYDGRMLPIEKKNISWEDPIFTTVNKGTMFEYAPDCRVKIVVKHLIRIKEENVDLYRLIDEVDFGNSSFLKIALAGLDYRLKVRASHFYDDIMRFVEFVSGFNPDMNEVKIVDLCFDELIICN